jgi:hypothetical protein
VTVPLSTSRPAAARCRPCTSCCTARARARRAGPRRSGASRVPGGRTGAAAAAPRAGRCGAPRSSARPPAPAPRRPGCRPRPGPESSGCRPRPRRLSSVDFCTLDGCEFIFRLFMHISMLGFCRMRC